jgi:hypothetical protein
VSVRSGFGKTKKGVLETGVVDRVSPEWFWKSEKRGFRKTKNGS